MDFRGLQLFYNWRELILAVCRDVACTRGRLVLTFTRSRVRVVHVLYTSLLTGELCKGVGWVGSAGLVSHFQVRFRPYRLAAFGRNIKRLGYCSEGI